jgi:hypothetical protein
MKFSENVQNYGISMLPLEGYPKELALSLSAITNIENKTALSE